MFNEKWGGLPDKEFLARLDRRLGDLRDKLGGKTYLNDASAGRLTELWARKLGLKIAVLENREGQFVMPTERNCTAALSTAEMPENLRVFVPDPSGQDSYPIVTFSWVLLYKSYPDARQAKSLRDLFQWCLLEGQQYAPNLGYVPLPEKVIEKTLAVLNTVGPR